MSRPRARARPPRAPGPGKSTFSLGPQEQRRHGDEGCQPDDDGRVPAAKRSTNAWDLAALGSSTSRTILAMVDSANFVVRLPALCSASGEHVGAAPAGTARRPPVHRQRPAPRRRPRFSWADDTTSPTAMSSTGTTTSVVATRGPQRSLHQVAMERRARRTSTPQPVRHGEQDHDGGLATRRWQGRR